jgi:hypothetical protein
MGKGPQYVQVRHCNCACTPLKALSLGGAGRETPYQLEAGLKCTGVLAMRVRQNHVDPLSSRYPLGFGIAGRGGSGGPASAPLLPPPGSQTAGMCRGDKGGALTRPHNAPCVRRHHRLARGPLGEHRNPLKNPLVMSGVDKYQTS